MKSDSGTIAPYIAGLLALTLFTILGSITVGTSLIASNRIQAVADAAVIYGHDRAHKKGIPMASLLRQEVAIFMQSAPSVRRLTALSYQAQVDREYSSLKVCARFVNPIGIGANSGQICKNSRAKSFLIP